MFPATSYDPDTLSLLGRVFEEAWMDTKAMIGPRPLDPESIRSGLAKRIMEAAESGERDPKRLKLLALRAIDG